MELDPERVETAKPYENDLTLFRQGGFNIPLPNGNKANIILAFNVLRQYEEFQVEEFYTEMANYFMPGGILIEGTSDPNGRIWVANLIQKKKDASLDYLGISFSTNFRWGFSPNLFPPVLPKNLINKMVPGEIIHKFISGWENTANSATAHKAYGIRQWFV